MKLDLDLPHRTHIAIMKKSWRLLPKIVSGEKTIESRWYKNRSAPWDRISDSDIIYFKDSGEPVTVKAKVSKVLQFADLTEEKVEEILKKYGCEIGMNADVETVSWCAKRRYCILVFLKDPQLIEPVEIDKTGFGNACAWMIADNIESVKK